MNFSENYIKEQIKALDNRATELRVTLNEIMTEKKELQKLLLSTKEYNGASKKESVLVVSTVQLKPIIQLWIDEGRTLQALSKEAAVSDKTLIRILTGETRFTSELIADSVRQAVGVPFYELTFIPDPRKRPESQYFEK